MEGYFELMSEPEVFQVELLHDDKTRSIQVSRDEHIWDAASKAGIVLPALCHQGYCLTCAGRLENGGEIDQNDSAQYYPEDCRAGFVLLCTGYYFIRRKQWRKHRACMLAAVAVSGLFLTSYVIYHAQVGSVPFRGTGWIRTVYFAVFKNTHIFEDTRIVEGDTFGTGMGSDLDFYREIPLTSMPYGQAMAILCLAEYCRTYY